MTRRLRLALGLALAALAGWWAARAVGARYTAGELVAAWDAIAGTAGAPRPPAAALRPDEPCPDCPHLGRRHDPDLGCLGPAPYVVGTCVVLSDPCDCRRRGCTRPGRLDASPPGRRD